MSSKCSNKTFSISSFLANALSTLQVGSKLLEETMLVVVGHWVLLEECWLVVVLRLQVESNLLEVTKVVVVVVVSRMQLKGCWLVVALRLQVVYVGSRLLLLVMSRLLLTVGSRQLLLVAQIC